MAYEDSLAWWVADVHSYFPEWAARRALPGTPSECDHNSYMAGGYAEEFGYRMLLEGPAAVSLLERDPEESIQWRVQMGALHPGYPECPRPVDRDGFETDLLEHKPREAAMRTHDLPREVEAPLTIVRVRAERRFAPAAEGPSLLSWWRALRILRRGMSRVL